MLFNIEFINTTNATANYSELAEAEYEAGQGDGIELYTAKFEAEHDVAHGEDIGGLIVYSSAGELSAVYDYENFVGWVV